MKLFLWVALCVAMAAYREIYIDFNTDSGWLLYATQRFLNGEHLYVDILETNPPLILYLSAAPVALAQWLHLSSMTVFLWMVTALSLASLYLTLKVLEKSDLPQRISQGFPVYFAFALFVLPTTIYGEREHLWIVLILPYLAQSLNSAPAPRRNVTIALLAGIGFAIKPFFLAVWLANMAFELIAYRDWRRICSPTNIIIGVVQLLYVLVIAIYTPAYFTLIVPILMHTYSAYNGDMQTIVGRVTVLMGYSFALVWITRPKGRTARITIQLLLWMVACCVTIALQKKEWINHFYPLIFMTGLCLTTLLLWLVQEWRTLKLDIGYRKFIALCFAVVGLGIATYVNFAFVAHEIQHRSKLDERLLVAIHRYAPHEYIYPLMFNLQVGFPAINYSEGVFKGAFQSLWALPGIIAKERKNIADPDIASIKQFVFAQLAHDFTRYPPALVWVDNNANNRKKEWINYDILAYLLKNPEFAAVWKHYKYIGDIESDIRAAPGDKNDKAEAYALYKRVK